MERSASGLLCESSYPSRTTLNLISKSLNANAGLSAQRNMNSSDAVSVMITRMAMTRRGGRCRSYFDSDLTQYARVKTIWLIRRALWKAFLLKPMDEIPRMLPYFPFPVSPHYSHLFIRLAGAMLSVGTVDSSAKFPFTSGMGQGIPNPELHTFLQGPLSSLIFGQEPSLVTCFTAMIQCRDLVLAKRRCNVGDGLALGSGSLTDYDDLTQQGPKLIPRLGVLEIGPFEGDALPPNIDSLFRYSLSVSGCLLSAFNYDITGCEHVKRQASLQACCFTDHMSMSKFAVVPGLSRQLQTLVQASGGAFGAKYIRPCLAVLLYGLFNELEHATTDQLSVEIADWTAAPFATFLVTAFISRGGPHVFLPSPDEQIFAVGICFRVVDDAIGIAHDFVSGEVLNLYLAAIAHDVVSPLNKLAGMLMQAMLSRARPPFATGLGFCYSLLSGRWPLWSSLADCVLATGIGFGTGRMCQPCLKTAITRIDITDPSTFAAECKHHVDISPGPLAQAPGWDVLASLGSAVSRGLTREEIAGQLRTIDTLWRDMLNSMLRLAQDAPHLQDVAMMEAYCAVYVDTDLLHRYALWSFNATKPQVANRLLDNISHDYIH